MKYLNIIGKVGHRIVLCHRKAPNQAANQRWIFTKDGHIALQSHPKLVMAVKSSVKETQQLVLADSGSKDFQKTANLAKWTMIPLLKKKRRSMYSILLSRDEIRYL